MRKITITVGPDGTVEAEAEGFKGKTCETAINSLLQDVAERETTTEKDEYWLEEEPEALQESF